MFQHRVFRTLYILISPNGLLLALTFLTLRFITLPETKTISEKVIEFLFWYPYIIAAIGLLLGWRFHRVKLVYATILFIGANQAILWSSTRDYAKFVEIFVIFFMPLNIAMLSRLRERSVFSYKGLWILSVLLVQFGLIYSLSSYFPRPVLRWISSDVIHVDWTEYGSISHISAFIFLVTLIFVFSQFFKSKTIMESGILWSLVSAFFAIMYIKNYLRFSTYLSTAGFILIVSVVEASYQLAYHDELTSLPARRAMNETLAELNNKYTLCMVDIDFFKKFNDRYGHDVGDQVLRMIATRLAKVAHGGKAFRYGGEEFLIVFPGKTKEEVIDVVEALRKSISEHPFIIRGSGMPRSLSEQAERADMNLPPVPLDSNGREKVTITVSMGIAERNESLPTPEDVIKAADWALYRAKRTGRNRVCADTDE